MLSCSRCVRYTRLFQGIQSRWTALYGALSSKILWQPDSILIHPVWTLTLLESTKTLILLTSLWIQNLSSCKWHWDLGDFCRSWLFIFLACYWVMRYLRKMEVLREEEKVLNLLRKMGPNENWSIFFPNLTVHFQPSISIMTSINVSSPPCPYVLPPVICAHDLRFYVSLGGK